MFGFFDDGIECMIMESAEQRDAIIDDMMAMQAQGCPFDLSDFNMSDLLPDDFDAVREFYFDMKGI